MDEELKRIEKIDDWLYNNMRWLWSIKNSIIHPFVILRMHTRKLFQRIFRKTHVADYDCWSLSLTMAPYILRHLTQFKNSNRMGYPAQFSEWDENLGITKEEFDERKWGGGEEAWNNIINEMIFAFEFMLAEEHEYDKRKSYYKNFVKKYDYDWHKEKPENLCQLKVYENEQGDVVITDDPDEKLKIVDSPLSRPFYYDKEMHKYLSKRSEKGFELFGKYYMNLWD